MYLSDSPKGPYLDAGSTDVASSVFGYTWPSNMKGQKNQPVRVFLADEDRHIRSVIAQELMRDPRTILVGQASSYREARKGILAEEFDVLLVDLSLSEGQGADLLELVQLRMPNVLSIAISSSEKDDTAIDAFKKGVVGYFLKNSWFGSYSQAVLEVANGGASISPTVAKKILPKIFKYSAPEEGPLDHKKLEKLTDREKEVLRLIAQGKRTHEIGDYMKISALTVSTHVKNIYRKMQVRTRAQAVRYAVMKGII